MSTEVQEFNNSNSDEGKQSTQLGDSSGGEHAAAGSSHTQLPGQIGETPEKGGDGSPAGGGSRSREKIAFIDDDMIDGKQNDKPMTKKGSTGSSGAGSIRSVRSGASIMGAIFLRGKSKRQGGDGGEDDDAAKSQVNSNSNSTNELKMGADSKLGKFEESVMGASQSQFSASSAGSPLLGEKGAASLRVDRDVDKSAKIEQQQQRLKSSILASRVALKKVQRVFEDAERITTNAFTKAMKGRENPEPIVRAYADEFEKICLTHHEKCLPPNLSGRFRRMTDEYRSLRFDLHGIAEHVKALAQDSQAIAEEVHQIAKPIALLWLQEKLDERGDSLIFCSERSILDLNSGLVVQKWPNAEAPKRWVKALNRFMNTPLCMFQVPLTVLFEVCGHSYTAAAMVPLSRKIKHPTKTSDWIKFHIQAAICNHHFPLDDEKVHQDSLFSLGCNGHMYCLNALGLMPWDLSDSFLVDYEGSLDEKESIKKQTTSSTDRVCTDLIALSRANMPKVNSILHKFGLKMQHVHMVHGALSQAEAVRDSTAGIGEDPNLTAALRTVVTELLSRVLKLVLREEFKKIKPQEEDKMAAEMGAIASQMVFSQIIEDTEHVSDGQLFKTTLKLSAKMYPQFGTNKKALWDETYVSENQIAQRIAQLTGLAVVKGIIVGLNAGRLVRATTFPADNPRLNALRGKQRELMQKLVSRVKSSRKHSPHNATFLTFQLADLFHQTTGRSNVSGSPRAIYEQLKVSEDNPFMNQIETSIQYCLVMQQLHLMATKFSTDSSILTDRFRNFMEHVHTMTANSPDDPFTPFLLNLKSQVLLAFARYYPHQHQLIQAQETTLSSLNNLSRNSKVHPQQAYWMWEYTYEGMTACLLATRPQLATERAQQRLEHAAQVFGEQSVPTAAAYNDIAATLVQRNELPGAEEHFKKAFDLFVTLNDESQTVFTTANNLGYTYFRMADEKMPPNLKKRRFGFLKFKLPEEVIALLNQAADMFNYVADNQGRCDVKTVADALNNLGSVLLYRGKFFDSVETITKSLQLTRGILSDDHPDRSGALHNLKMAEKRMKSNASLFIACWYKRFQARKKLRLLRDGNKHVVLFQRIGRGFFLRVQLYWLAEKKRMKRNVKNDLNDWGGAKDSAGNKDSQAEAKASLMQDLNFDDDDVDQAPTQKKDGGAAGFKKKNVLDMSGDSAFGGDDNDSNASPPKKLARRNSLALQRVDNNTITDSSPKKSDVPLSVVDTLQRVGRGMLTRGMLHKLATIRAARKPRRK